MTSGYTISPQQRRVWPLLQQGAPLGVQARVRLQGAFDAKHLESSLAQLLADQLILRTNYRLQEGVQYPLQVVREQGRCDLAVLDLRGLSGQEQASRLREGYAPAWTSPAEAGDNPPLRVRVLRWEDQAYEWVISLPALAADSHSLKTIVAALVGGYLAAGEPAGAPPLIQYVQFAEWQNQLLDAPNPDAAYFWQKSPVEHWRRSRLSLQPPGAAGSGGLQTRSLALPAGWTLQAGQLASHTRTSLPAILAAALGLLVHKHAGPEDVVVGWVAPNRKYEQLDATLGLLSKMLPVPVAAAAAEHFAALAGKVHQAMEQAQAWADYFTGSYLAGAAAETPVLPVGFQWVELDEALPGDGQGRFAWLDFQSRTEPFGLQVTGRKQGDQLTVELAYDPAQWEEAAVAVVLQQYAALLEHAVRTPLVPTAQLSLLGPAERDRVVYGFNAAVQPLAGEGIVARFEQQAARTPDAVALVAGAQTWTYAALNAGANRLARCLREQYGVRSGHLVALLLERSPRAIVSLLAVLKAGGAYVPLDVQYPAGRIRHILEDARVRLVITESADAAAGFPAVPALPYPEEAVPWAHHSAGNLPEKADPGDLAYVMYTSGSTGTPKGVQITVANLTNYVTWANGYYFGNETGKTFALFTSLAFDLTVTSIFTTLLRGDRLVIYPHDDMHRTLTQLFDPASGIDAVKLTPSHVSLLKVLELPPTKVAYAILGGEALTRPQLETLWSLNPDMRLFNEYGPTETTVGSTVAELHPGEAHITIGTPIANTRVYLLDEALQPCAIGQPGEICIGGAGLSRGYLHLPAATAARFVADPFQAGAGMYRTGDWGQWLPDGRLLYAGRKDKQLKIRGHRIELGEIEQALLAKPGVLEAVVAAYGEGEDRYLAAYLVGKAQPDPGSLRAMLSSELPGFMVPAYFIGLDKLPLTTNGKVDWERLPDPVQAATARRTACVAPRNATEEALLAIWAEVLGNDRIGVEDDFFAIGGQSIKALQIITRISKAWQVGIGLTALFANPTIARLAQHLDKAEKITYRPIAPLPAREWYDVSFAQRRLWILDKLETNKSLYNMPGVFALEGHFHYRAFEQTIAALLERHESLRTTFIDVGGEPRQKIHPPAEMNFRVGYTDLRGREHATEWLTGQTAQEVAAPFSLEKGPLWRVHVWQPGDAHHVVTFTMHHIISDAWSIGLLVSEISALYNSFSQGLDNSLAPLRVQYKEYAAWQNELLEATPGLRQYWLNRLSPLPPRLNLPADFPRPAVKTLAGKKQLYVLEPPLVQGLAQLGQQAGVSQFTVLLSAFYALLHRLTGQQDLVIGTSVAGRDHLDLEGQIGFFVNLLALRTALDGDLTFRQLLYRVHENTLGAFEHQRYPFDRLVEDLNLKRELNRTPLFDVLVVLQNTRITEESGGLANLAAEGLDVDMEKSEFDLIFNLIPGKDQLVIAAHYSTELFEPETIQIMLEKLKLLGEALVQQPDGRLADLEIELAEERKVKEKNASLEFNFG